MSRMIRRRLLSIMDLLNKANQVLEKQFQMAAINEEEIVDLLSKCQDGAVAMGEIIENLHGEGAETIKELEDYCRMLYSLALTLGDAVARWEYFGRLKKYVQRLHICIDKEVPDKLEVVFLPYKASMWDSLESVYWAAKEDTDCDIYVVPIPYYDITQEHEMGEFHYEGSEFPPEIEITDWQTFPLENRNPDMIFIHNPYDDCNLVTSVLPRFFAKNLRNYTDCLVYIPYFVLEEIEPEDQGRIKGIRHFCFLPGVVFADKVIVQSEKMRSIYISEYIKAAQEHGIKTNRSTIENKFLGLGSPKIDKVLGTRREECTVPKTWLDKIQKPNGSPKKVILYNTSISPFLEHQERMLRKIKSVFSIFREKKQDVALLWRPHPLLQATIASMHPKLWKGYKEIVDEYLAENWGIYDDTPDVERAIAISDVYYGDASSLVWMYRTTRKPVMLQDVWMLEDDYFPTIPWGTYARGYIWGTRFRKDGLYRINPRTGKMDLEILLGKRYARAVPYKDRILLIPGETDHIGVFQMDTGEISHYSIQQIINKKVFLKFSSYVTYKEYLFFFPSCSEYIVIVNIETMQIEYMEEPVKEYKKKYEMDPILFSTEIYCENNMAYVPCYTENMIFFMDLETRKYHWEKVPLNTEKRGISSLVKDGNRFFLTSQEGGVFCWNRDFHSVQLLLKDDYFYIAIVLFQGTLWLFPNDRSPVINYNIIENSKVEYTYDEMFRFGYYTGKKFNGIIKAGNKIYFGLECANGLIEVDMLQKKLKYIKIRPDLEVYRQYVEMEIFMEEYLSGGIGKCLEFLIEKANKQISREDNHYCGRRIYKELIKSKR